MRGLLCLASARAEFSPRTTVSLNDGRWHLNGTITHRGAAAEGLLLNVRMVNAIFEDLERPDFDPESNTGEFIARIPEYVAAGVRAFTLSLQGGLPGYEGARNSAFDAEGRLRSSYLARAARVIEACDRAGAVVILGCFYQRQDEILRDAGAVRHAVVETAAWLRERGYANVLLEITNEFGHAGFDHALLKTAAGQVELMELARHTAPRLLISTAGLGRAQLPAEVIAASDFLLVHFNGTPLEALPGRLAVLRRSGKAIVCNEDVKTGPDGVRVLDLCIEHGASWGLMLREHNQQFPFAFDGIADDPLVYAAFRRVTTPALSR